MTETDVRSNKKVRQSKSNLDDNTNNADNKEPTIFVDLTIDEESPNNNATQNDLTAHPPVQIVDEVQQCILNPNDNTNNGNTEEAPPTDSTEKSLTPELRATQNDLAAHPPAQVMDVVQQQTVLNPDHNENNAQTKCLPSHLSNDDSSSVTNEIQDQLMNDWSGESVDPLPGCSTDPMYNTIIHQEPSVSGLVNSVNEHNVGGVNTLSNIQQNAAYSGEMRDIERNPLFNTTAYGSYEIVAMANALPADIPLDDNDQLPPIIMTLRRIQNVAGPSHLNGQYLVNDPYEWRKIICKQIQERRKRADCKSKPYKKKTKVLFFKKFNSVNLKAHKFKTYLISLEQVTRQNFWPKTIYDCANAMYINLGLPVYRGNTEQLALLYETQNVQSLSFEESLLVAFDDIDSHSHDIKCLLAEKS